MSWLDWVVLGAYAAIMLGVGVYYSHQNKTSDDYLLGGRRMSPFVVGLSLFATLVSTLSYLAGPGEMVSKGPMYITQLLAHPFTFVIVGFGLIPLLMKQPVTSAYEILETRLGRGIRTAGATVFLLLRLGWMATILFATSREVLIPLLGLGKEWIAPICIIVGVIAAIYSSMGGIKAVVVTDGLQAVTMIAGAIATIWVVTNSLGGVSAWWPSTWPSHWSEPNWGFDPSARMSMGTLILSTMMWYICTNGSDQMSVQRFLSTRNPAAARRTLAVSLSTDAIMSFLLALTGLAILGFYQARPDHMAAGQTLATSGDSLFPRFILNEMPGGVAGLVIAAIISAALSSLSSGINSACGVIEKDFLERSETGTIDSARAVSRMRWLTWLVTFLAISLSMLNLLVTGDLLERCYKLVNLLTAPLFSLFFLALFIPWANAPGAWVSLISAATVAIAVAYDKDLHLGLNVSFIWMMPASLTTGIITGTLASALFQLVKPSKRPADI